MSTRWMAVQYVGDILRIPVANESDMSMPFGSSTLERDVRRIVANPFSDSPQVFVPEAENAKLRELLSIMAYCNQFRRDCDGCSMNGAAGIITERAGCDELLARLRELGVEVDG